MGTIRVNLTRQRRSLNSGASASLEPSGRSTAGLARDSTIANNSTYVTATDAVASLSPAGLSSTTAGIAAGPAVVAGPVIAIGTLVASFVADAAIAALPAVSASLAN